MKRTPLKRRTPIRSPRRDGPTVDREPKPWAKPTLQPLHRGTYAGGASGVSVVKPEPVKPGKRAPTKDEAAWMSAIVAYGCIACRLDGLPPRPTAVHHILRGGRRIGHKATLPLCDPGHHQGGEALGLVSRHPWKARFEQRYGSEDFLLSHLQGVLKLQQDGSYAPKK